MTKNLDIRNANAIQQKEVAEAEAERLKNSQNTNNAISDEKDTVIANLTQ